MLSGVKSAETVWRYFEIRKSQLFSICDKCFLKREEWRGRIRYLKGWFERYVKEDWREPLPCVHCGRPVRIPTRYQRRPIICGKECRAAVANARARARLRRVLPPRVCAKCGHAFTPRRTDTRFCSLACKQSAYRRRRRSLEFRLEQRPSQSEDRRELVS